jgi:hypothetical protein
MLKGLKSMKSYISVVIPTAQFIKLIDFLRTQGSQGDPAEAISMAIDYWMDNAAWKAQDLLPEVSTGSRGYTWKYKDTCIFLPHGTEIRMPYKGQYHYARVDSDKIIYMGETVSPGALANKITKSSRNAWKDLWIKRPGENEWVLADERRRKSNKDLVSIPKT